MCLKILGSIFLIASAATIGCMKADELRQRVKSLNELKRSMILLQGELRFHRATLSEAFENISGRVKYPFDKYFEEISKALETENSVGFLSLWSEMSEKIISDAGLKKEDKALLELLGGSLGFLDITMQIENLNLTILQTEDAISSAKEQLTVKGKLYQTMGVTVGAFLTLLII